MLRPITSTNPLSGYDPKMETTLAEHALNLGAEAVPSFEELVKKAIIINTLERLPVADEKRLLREYEELLRVYQTISIASTSNESYPSEARSKFLRELGEVMQPFLLRHQARKTLHRDSTASPSFPISSAQASAVPPIAKCKNADLWLLPEVDPPTSASRNECTVASVPNSQKQPDQEKLEINADVKKQRSSRYFSGMTNVIDYFKVARSRSPSVILK